MATVKPFSTRWSASPSTSGLIPGTSGMRTTPGPAPFEYTSCVRPPAVKGADVQPASVDVGAGIGRSSTHGTGRVDRMWRKHRRPARPEPTHPGPAPPAAHRANQIHLAHCPEGTDLAPSLPILQPLRREERL